MHQDIIMDNGFFLVTPIHDNKLSGFYVPLRVAENINKGIVLKADPDIQFKVGDLVTFHRTEGFKFGSTVLLHETQTFGYDPSERH